MIRSLSEIEMSVRVNIQYRDAEGNLPEASVLLAEEDLVEAMEEVFPEDTTAFRHWALALLKSAGADKDVQRDILTNIRNRELETEKQAVRAENLAKRGVKKVKPSNGKILEMLKGGPTIDNTEDAEAVLATVLQIARRVNWATVEKTPEIKEALVELKKLLK